MRNENNFGLHKDKHRFRTTNESQQEYESVASTNWTKHWTFSTLHKVRPLYQPANKVENLAKNEIKTEDKMEIN